MAENSLSPQELQFAINGTIINVSLFNVRVAGRQMGGEEAKCRVVVLQTDSHPAFVTRHSS